MSFDPNDNYYLFFLRDTYTWAQDPLQGGPFEAISKDAFRKHARYRSYFCFRESILSDWSTEIYKEVRAKRDWLGTDQGRAWYRATEEEREHLTPPPNGTRANLARRFAGPYTFPALVLDLDSSATRTPLEVLEDVKATSRWLTKQGVQHNLFLSGSKGFHIEVCRSFIGCDPVEDCARVLKRFCDLLAKEVWGRSASAMGRFDLAPLHRGGVIRLQAAERELKACDGGRARYKVPVLHSSEVKLHSDLIWTRRDWLELPRAQEPNPVLADLWDRALKSQRKSVHVFRPSNGYGPQRGAYVGLDALFAHYDVDCGIKKGAVIDCPHPDHAHGLKKAILYPTGWVRCWRCHANVTGLNAWSPTLVAHWLGIRGVTQDPGAPLVAPDLTPLRQSVATALRSAICDPDKSVIEILCPPVGSGKSHASSDATAYAMRAGIVRGVLICAPTERLGREHQERLVDAQSVQKVLPWTAEERCGRVEFEFEEAVTTGQVHLERAQSLGEARLHACYHCPLNPRSPNYVKGTPPCAFKLLTKEIATRAEEGAVVVATSANLRHKIALDQVGSGADLVVIDEAALESLIDVQAIDLITLAEEAARCTETRHFGGVLPSEAVRLVEEHARKGEVWGPQYSQKVGINWKGAEIAKEYWLEFGGTEEEAINLYLEKLVPETSHQLHENLIPTLGADPTRRAAEVRPVELDGFLGLGAEAQERIAELDTLTRFKNTLLSGGIAGIEVVEREQDGRKERHLLIKKVVSGLENKKIVLLDASLKPCDLKLIEAVTGKRTRVWETARSVNPTTTLIQDPSSAYSRKGVRKNKDEEKNKRRDQVLRFVKHVAAKHCNQVGLIGRKGCELLQEASTATGAEVMTYGSVRGLNRFADKRALVLIGDPAPNWLAFELERFRRDLPQEVVVCDYREGIDHGPIDNPYYRLNYPARGPVGRKEQANLTPTQLDLARAAYEAALSDELYQAIGRIRPLSGEGKVIYYLGASYPGDLATGLVAYRVDTGLIWIDRPAPHDNGVTLDPVALGERARTSSLSLTKLAEVVNVPRRTLSELAKGAGEVGETRELVVGFAEDGLLNADIAEIAGVSKQRVSKILQEEGG